MLGSEVNTRSSVGDQVCVVLALKSADLTMHPE